MNREQAAAAFDAYVSSYDPENTMIRLKIVHTYHVAEIAGRIARTLGQGELEDFAWFLGLLHDIGRFEQVRQYGTFSDAQSVDHAEFGADILFCENLIDRFPTETLPEGWRDAAETAIRQHNKLALPGQLDERTRTLAQVLRDADKIDIFRVAAQNSYEERAGRSVSMMKVSDEMTPEVMNCVMEHRCVPRGVRRSIFDVQVSYCCMAFELVYKESRRIAAEQGNLLKLLMMQDKDGCRRGNEKQLRQLEIVRREIEKAWGMSLISD